MKGPSRSTVFSTQRTLHTPTGVFRNSGSDTTITTSAMAPGDDFWVEAAKDIAWRVSGAEKLARAGKAVIDTLTALFTAEEEDEDSGDTSDTGDTGDGGWTGGSAVPGGGGAPPG